METLALLKNKNILVLGLGATGLSCARFLASQGYDFTVNDSRLNPPGSKRLKQLNAKVELLSGQWNKNAIQQADVIIASPGVDVTLDEIQGAMSPKCKLIGDVELFCQINNSKMIAVTGSNGKSTVVTLLHHMAQYCQINSALAGNIGVPVLDIAKQEKDVVILELSSFQLETMTSMQAEAATVLNICDDHLDRHKTLDNYRSIKQKIYQQSKRHVVNRQQSISQPEYIGDKDVTFGLDQPNAGHFGVVDYQGKRHLTYGDKILIACENLPLVGQHNELNCLAALALGYCAGWPLAEMVNALPSFEGLDHRCKRIDTFDDIVWVNDSKATNIGATIAAIEGLANAHQKLILIAGGDGKGADFSELKPSLKHVDHLITLGKDGGDIAALKNNSIEVKTLEEAVEKSREIAKVGDMVLLSPACASIDMFNNYMQRGDMFIAAVREVR